MDRFQVWAEPGTGANEAKSLIVDWAAGSTIPAQTAPVYQISFETTRRDPSSYTVVEGLWFRAWSEWEKLANPLIEKVPRIR